MEFAARRKNEIWACLLLAVSFFLTIALFSYDLGDTFFRASPTNSPIQNRTGVVGAYLSEALILFFGMSAFLFPVILLVWTLSRFFGIMTQRFSVKFFGLIILLLSTCTLVGIGNPDSGVVIERGGVVGLVISDLMQPYFGIFGSRVVIIALMALSLLLATEFLFIPFLVSGWQFLGRQASQFQTYLEERQRRESLISQTFASRPRIISHVSQKRPAAMKTKDHQAQQSTLFPKVTIQPPKKIRLALARKKKEPKPAHAKFPTKKGASEYVLPSVNILSTPSAGAPDGIEDDLTESMRVLETTLSDFGIEARIVQVNQGPVITRYELLPAPGVKVNRITALSDDIALSMKAQTVRIVAPIPGKAAVGIEVPNSKTSLVHLQEILQSQAFVNLGSKITMALGKDISGSALTADLSQMPHILIAGTTGSGKTVCINSVITGILFNASPEEVRFLMVDPKMVELAVYNRIPHLLCPVVTNPKKAALAFNWLVAEMDSRYKRFAGEGVRDIKMFNTRNPNARMPLIVLVIDELADLMMAAQDKVETAITRLAQLARAAGIHMILATQRPSVDVITGVIKANFPARISFKVASKVDSRTVLDTMGADKLLGKGDFLFLKPGSAKPIRGQACLVTDEEVEKVVEAISQGGGNFYDESLMRELENKSTLGGGDRDELFDDSVRVILDTGQASTSMLQRRLRLGYTRAARIIDQMEQAGIVGRSRGAKPRDILISQWPMESDEEEAVVESEAAEEVQETVEGEINVEETDQESQGDEEVSQDEDEEAEDSEDTEEKTVEA